MMTLLRYLVLGLICLLPFKSLKAFGPIPGLKPSSLIGFYYGDWDEGLIQEVAGLTGQRRYDLVVVHPQSNLSRTHVQALQQQGVKVIGYLSVGEDAGSPHTSPRSWFFEHNHDGKPDRNGAWGSYYANPGDPAWRRALRSYRNLPGEGWYGYDYLMKELGCDGLFLDTVDTVMPRAWGGAYGASLPDMVGLIAQIRREIPRGKLLLMNRGLFFFDPAYLAPEVTPALRDRVRGLVNGVLYENYIEDAPAERERWAGLISQEAAKRDGFTIMTLDYLNPKQADPGRVKKICQEVLGRGGWLPFVSEVHLEKRFHHAVRDLCATTQAVR